MKPGEMNPQVIGEALRAPVLRLEFSEYLTLSDGVWHPGVKITVKDAEPGSRWRTPFKQSVMGPQTRADLLRALADLVELQDDPRETCFICGAIGDHDGQPHGVVTGDGKTRKDVG